MIRPFTCLCLIAAGASGLYLYSEKHRTALLDRDIGRLIHATEAARARTGSLRAEWALLNEPGRLQDMAARYLTLHSMAPTQFVQIADLSAHLPVAMSAGASVADDDDAPAVAAAAAGGETMADGVQADAAGAFPAHHPMQPVLVQGGAKPDSHAGTRVARADLHRAPRRMVLADRQDAPMHDGLLARGTPLPLAAPQPVSAHVYSAMARPMRMQASHPTIMGAMPSLVPAYHSALGGGGSLPPPVPYGR